MKKAIEAVLAAPWAITPEYMELIAAIAEREHEFAGNLEALEAKLGRPLGNTMTASVRDGVAVIPVEGPLFKRASLFAAMSGATDYATIARDFTVAQQDPAISATILVIDSPGGEVRGVAELEAMIRAAEKPVWVFVEGAMASAAFWLGSAADKIIASPTSSIGSVGAMAGYKLTNAKPGERSYTFVSSQSPQKNAGPETDAGARQIQANVDHIADVFIDTLARNRNTSREVVLESFGQGAVFVAGEAEKRGMIDGIGTFESTLETLKQEINSMDYSKLTVAALAEHRADLVAEIKAAAVAGVEQVDVNAIRAEAATAERERIAAIEAMELPGTAELIAKFKADGTKPETAAIEIVKAAKAIPQTTASGDGGKGAQHLASLKQTETSLTPPNTGNGTDAAATVEDAAAAAIALARKAGVDA